MADAKHPHRIAAGRNKFSSIPHICLEIRTAISPVRHRSAVAVCKSQPDPNNGGAAERNQTRQFSHVSRDFNYDQAADLRRFASAALTIRAEVPGVWANQVRYRALP